MLWVIVFLRPSVHQNREREGREGKGGCRVRWAMKRPLGCFVMENESQIMKLQCGMNWLHAFCCGICPPLLSNFLYRYGSTHLILPDTACTWACFCCRCWAGHLTPSMGWCHCHCMCTEVQGWKCRGKHHVSRCLGADLMCYLCCHIHPCSPASGCLSLSVTLLWGMYGN